jgi:predicted GIY-YIG superfamily endonuclease
MPAWYVYALTDSSGRLSYAGVTINLKRRLRQHNRLIGGGARSTGRGQDWCYLFVVKGLPSGRVARQLEWRLHRRTKEGRAEQLRRALLLERFTTGAPPTSTLALTVCWGADRVSAGEWPANVTHCSLTQESLCVGQSAR